LSKEQNKNKNEVGDMLSSANDISVCFGNCLENEAVPVQVQVQVQLTSEQQEEALDRRIELLQFVLTFYSHYNAKNIANVDQIVDLYLGREQELLLNLQQKYDLKEAPTLDWRPPEQQEPAPTSACKKSATQQLSCNTSAAAARAKAAVASLPEPPPVSLSPMAPRHEEAEIDLDETATATATAGRQSKDWVPKTTVIDSRPKSIFGLFKSKSAKSKEFFVAAETTEENASFGYFRRRASSSSGTAVIMHL